MLPREVIRQIRRLQIRARRAVEDLVGGEYHSVFKGMGIAFEEVREYQPGDDIRTIDWNVTARMGHPFIKRFVEERELTVLLAVDCSASNLFGTQLQQKREVAAELAAILAFSAIRIADPREEEMPAVGLLDLEDAETGDGLVLDTSSRKVRTAYAEAARRRRETVRRLSRSSRIDLIEVSTDGGHLDALIRFFHL